MGLATWYSPDSDYTGLPQNLQPMDRSLVPSGRGAPGVGIQTCCVIHGCLGHRLGSHVQRARSSGVWTGPQLRWHSNCLELLAVLLALSRLRGRLRGKYVLVRTDNTATFAYINRQCILRSCHMSQLARHLLLWSQKHLRSRHTIHIPGVFNQMADELS